MKEEGIMEFSKMTDLTCAGQGYFTGKLMMPNQCPYCHKNNHVQPKRILELPICTEDTAILVSTKCSECDNNYIVFFQRNKDKTRLEFLQLVPILEENADYEDLYALSPAFEEIHKQAMQAYQAGMGRLAVIGFRTALEILMKDFVIYELHENKEKIECLSLNNMIQQYFKSLEDRDYARAIQALGNDCTHYISKHADFNPKDVELFYRMFIGNIKNRCECRRISRTMN